MQWLFIKQNQIQLKLLAIDTRQLFVDAINTRDARIIGKKLHEDKNGENDSKFEVVDFVLSYCNFANNHYTEFSVHFNQINLWTIT